MTTETELEELLSQGSPWFTLLFSVVLAPVMEELIFRKVLIDRTIYMEIKQQLCYPVFFLACFTGIFISFSMLSGADIYISKYASQSESIEKLI